MNQQLSKFCRRTSLAFAICLMLLSATTGGVARAISQNDFDSIINGTPFYDPTAQACLEGSSTVLTGNDNIQKAFNFLVGKGLTAPQSAGVIGNLIIESGVDPSKEEGGKIGLDMEPGRGYGIAQWTTAGRQDGLRKMAEQEGTQINNLGMQLDYLWREFTGGYSGMLKSLKATSDVDPATVVVMVQYEAPRDHDPNGPNAHARERAAESVLQQYGGSAQAGSATASACGNSVAKCDSSAPTGSYSDIKNALMNQFKINLQGDTNMEWATETYNTICKLASAPAFYSKLISQGSITVELHDDGKCDGGHASPDTGVRMHGFCDKDYNRYLLTHELGHMHAFRNPTIYQSFVDQIWGHYPSLPTNNCQIHYGDGPTPAECYADMIGEYDIYFDLRGVAAGGPPGTPDFKQYPTEYSGYYTFARDHIFGGTEFKSF